ncbi:hypothetical protein ACFL0P_00450 [Candidatus Omnitrophota bacterium]
MSKRIKAIFLIMFFLAFCSIFFSLKVEKIRRETELAKKIEDGGIKDAQDDEIYAETYIAPSVAQSQGLYIEGDFEGIGINDYGTEGIAKVTELDKSSMDFSRYFPLTEGSRWVYQDWWEIQDPEGEFEVESKHIGEKVRVKRINSSRTLKVVSVEDEGPIKRVKMEEEDYQGTRTREVEYLFPLEVGSKWEDTDLPGTLDREDNMYAYYVEKIEDVTVPAGTFKDCYKIVFRTNPDVAIEWFSPERGIIKAEYHHHGTITNYISELR